MKGLFFDCFAGISGDMALGALIDLGVPLRHIKKELEKLPIRGYSIKAGRTERMGISGKKITISIKAEAHHHRTFSDIEKLLLKSGLEREVKEHSRDIFYRIARAEAEVHRTRVEEVHFHEVGAVDSIIDIVGTAIALHHLGVDDISSSALPLGRGFVTCRHGTLPLPAPATLLLLKGIPVYDADVQGELVTPTGAAIIAHYATRFGSMPSMIVTRCGYGAGDRELPDRPNMLRLILGEVHGERTGEYVWSLETNIDDMNPEYAGYVMEQLFAGGALDVMFIPAYMKKNRPGMLLTVICTDKTRQNLTRILFQETTSAGIRTCRMERTVLPRRSGIVTTKFGKLPVKVFSGPDGDRIVPEFEVCRSAALRYKVPLKEVYAEIIASSRQTEPSDHKS